MPLVLTSGPAVEPVSVSEAKAHLRIDTTTEDALVASLLLTSRLHIEAALGIALITQTYTLRIDAWPTDGMIPLAIRPVRTVEEIRVSAIDGTPTVIADDALVLEAAGQPPRLVATSDTLPAPGRPAGGIEIDIVVGFGDAASDVPAPLRQAILLLTAHWFEHRDPIEIGREGTKVPAVVSSLVAPYREVRL